MVSKLIQIGSYEAESEQVLALRHAFEALEQKLRPPFPLTIPAPQEYVEINSALLYGVLCEPHLAKTFIKYLHAIVTDGYDLFLSLLCKLVNELYAKLVDSARSQLIWIAREMVDVVAIGIDGFLVCLLRQIVGGDFSDENLWLCSELVSLFLAKWDCLLEEVPLALTTALYTFLRVLADHCRFVSNEKLVSLKALEIKFCVKTLREQFQLCLKIGRDLIRLLLDLFHVPEFRAIWKDLVLTPSEFSPEFFGVLQVYQCRTSSRYFLLRITPEMETQLRFLLTHVKMGSQRRHQAWFSKKFLSGPERETVLVDIVRFICCAHHPTNEIIQSDIIPRWAVLGWLLKLCRKNYIEANVKLAMLYDWLFFDEGVDNIMNIEPAMLLMVHSVPEYIDMTHTLLEFLFLLVDNFDVDHHNVIASCVSSAFSVLVQKRVVCSLDIFLSSNAVSPLLRQKLEKLLSCRKVGFPKVTQIVLTGNSVPAKSAAEVSSPMTPRPSLKRPRCESTEDNINNIKLQDVAARISNDSHAPCCPSVITSESKIHDFEVLFQSLRDEIKQPNEMGLPNLEALLCSFLVLDEHISGTDLICPKVLASKIANEYEKSGYKLFAPAAACTGNLNCEDDCGSPTGVIIRTFIFSRQEKMHEMLLCWSHLNFPVGAQLLSYASRLAYEASTTGFLENEKINCKSSEVVDSGMSLLIFHVTGFLSFPNRSKEGSSYDISVAKLVENAFTAYRCFLTHSKRVLHQETGISISNLLFADLKFSCEWERKRTKYLFFNIFSRFHDLTMAEEDFIKLLVGQLSHDDLLDIQFEINLKTFSVFGESTSLISQLIMKSLNWDHLEQHKLWGLVRSELAVSHVQVENIIMTFFCCDEMDPSRKAIAIGGLLTLCGSLAPTPELVGAIMLLPNNTSQKFAPAALGVWTTSNSTMLFDSFAKFMEKLEKNSEDSIFSGTSGITVNHSAILCLLNYFNSKGIDISDLNNISGNDKKTVGGCEANLQDD